MCCLAGYAITHVHQPRHALLLSDRGRQATRTLLRLAARCSSLQGNLPAVPLSHRCKAPARVFSCDLFTVLLLITLHPSRDINHPFAFPSAAAAWPSTCLPSNAPSALHQLLRQTWQILQCLKQQMQVLRSPRSRHWTCSASSTLLGHHTTQWRRQAGACCLQDSSILQRRTHGTSSQVQLLQQGTLQSTLLLGPVYSR